MIELDKELHQLARRSIEELPINHLFALAVIENKTNGQVFADSLINPSAFYVKHPYGMSLLFGRAKEPEFIAALIDYLLDTNQTRKEDEWLQVYPNTWIDLIPVLGKMASDEGSQIEVHERINFKFDRSIFEANRKNINSLADGEAIVRTTSAVFNNPGGSVIPWYFWNDSDDFEQNGVGFTVTVNGEPASTAFSAFVHPQFLELGIETMENYRGRGYAYAVCSALIEYCLANDLEPVWACRGGNTGSMNLAHKLGFVETRRLPYFRIRSIRN